LKVIDLNGEWELEHVGGDLTVLAHVPGQVQLDLMRAGKLPDPYHGMNESECLWVGQGEWEYRRKFEADAKLLAEREAVLVCGGLDTVARVSVNGTEVGRADNMFRRYVFDVKSALREGENEVAVRFSSPVDYTKDKAESHPYPVPCGEQYRGLKTHRNFVRKSGTHFGWDWGPITLPVGIWRPIRIEAYSEARIRYVTVRQDHRGDGTVALGVRAFLQSPDGGSGKIEIAIPGARSPGGAARASKEVKLRKGENRVDLTLEIDSPELWWPHGYGEQKLYTLHLAFAGARGEADRITRRIGFRTVELVREPDAEPDTQGREGESFFFRVNGVPVYAKGANWIPAEAFYARVTRERLRSLLTSARDANMNMIRVWGGGVYEKRAFYDICDELGLMVWQDFMFACALYPASNEFLANVEAEARHQVRRLSWHPCVALWCGNNENEQSLGWSREAGENRDRYVVDYSRLYVDTLGRVAAEEDPDRAYWPSSPSNGVQEWGDPQDQTRGDVHYWGVWHGGKPFGEYLKIRPRFSSEFGFQSFPSVETLSEVLGEGDWNLTSPAMEHRQRSGTGNRSIIDHIARAFRMPKSFEDLIYLSQVLQAVSIKTAVEHWRRIKPWCMGSIYWQLNDIWQGPTWSSLEYDGRWKMLHYFAGRFFAPVLLSCVEEEGTLAVWVTSDEREKVKAKLDVALRTWSGEVAERRHASFDVPELGSRSVWDAEIEKMLGGRKREDCFVVVSAAGAGPAPLTNVHFLAPLKGAPLAVPEINITSTARGDREIVVTLKSDAVAPFVFLSAGDLRGRFSDNGFLLLSGETTEVSFLGWEDVDPDEFKAKLKVKSLRGSY